MRLMTALSRGQVPEPEASISKLVVAKTLRDMSAWGQELAGATTLINGEKSQFEAFNTRAIWAAGLLIADGTDEILRNLISERVFALPAEIRSDRNRPFNQLGATASARRAKKRMFPGFMAEGASLSAGVQRVSCSLVTH
jgi:hypothetical protein